MAIFQHAEPLTPWRLFQRTTLWPFQDGCVICYEWRLKGISEWRWRFCRLDGIGVKPIGIGRSSAFAVHIQRDRINSAERTKTSRVSGSVCPEAAPRHVAGILGIPLRL